MTKNKVAYLIAFAIVLQSCKLLSGEGSDPLTSTPRTAGPSAPVITGGTWQDPAIAPDSAHTAAYGGVSYAPNGDLYLFYQTGVHPNQNLQNVIRRNDASGWTAESYLGMRERHANAFFLASGKPYVATESGGSATIYSSANWEAAVPTWTSQAYFQGADGNPNGDQLYQNAYLTQFGSNLNLFFTYLYYNNVTGASRWGLRAAFQTAGSWPANGTQGTSIDNIGLVFHTNTPHGLAGAFQDSDGDMLVLGTYAYRSIDQGNTFQRVMNSGSPSVDLNGVAAAAKHPSDGSILVGNLYGAWTLAIWKTTDHGASFSKLTTVALGATPHRAKLISVGNLAIAAFTLGGSETILKTMVSFDSGATWSAPTTLVDATSGGNIGYTFGHLSLAANPITGAVALAYSLLAGTTHHGVYLKEFR